MKPIKLLKLAQGATLLEVLITVLVLAIGLLGVAALQTLSLRANQTAYARSQMTNLVYEMADFARANRAQVLATSTLPNMTYWNQRAATLLQDGSVQASINSGLNQITLEISWLDDRNAASATDQVTQIVVTTRF